MDQNACRFLLQGIHWISRRHAGTSQEWMEPHLIWLTSWRGCSILVNFVDDCWHRCPGAGIISREKLVARFEAFNRGAWSQLIDSSRNEKAAQCRRRQCRRRVESARVVRLVQVGELSSVRQVLERAALAPSNLATTRQLTDVEKTTPASCTFAT